MRVLRILDLFSGLGGFSQPFIDRGHEVVTVDIEPKFKPSVVADIRNLSSQSLPLAGEWDVVLASPPCQAFSIAAVYRHYKGHIPDQHVSHGLGLVACTLRLIAEFKPRYWVMENPCGMLRTFIGKPRETIYQCSFGAPWKKPTDLWGVWPGVLKRPCAPHQKAPRGSGSGVNSSHITDPAIRAKLPCGLGEELTRRIEAT